MKVIILPGNGNATPSTVWYQYVQSQLQAMGYEVILETMPDPELARSSYRLPWLESKTEGSPDVILIGHSSGAETILRYLEHHKVYMIVLIGVQYTDLGVEEEKQSGYYDKPREWQTIKSNASVIIQFASVDDPYIPIHEAHTIRDQLGSEYYEFPRKGHFMDIELPELIQVFKEKTSLMPRFNPVTTHTITNSTSTTSSVSAPMIDVPIAAPMFYDDDEVQLPVRSHRNTLTWFLPLCVLVLLGRLLYQTYFKTSQTDTDIILLDTGMHNTQIIISGDSQEDSLDAFLAEEGIDTMTTTIVTDTGTVNVVGPNGNNMPIIPDLNLVEGSVTNDDMLQVTPISPEEMIKIQKQYTDTKKISQFAGEGDKKLRKNFGIGDIFVEFVASSDHQQDSIRLTKNNQTQTFAAGYLGQGSSCYANKIGVFGINSQFLVYPTNCKDVYVFDTMINKNFVKQGQIIYFHNKQIIIGIKSSDGWTDLYTYDNNGWRQLVTNTIIKITTDNRGVYLIGKDSVTVLDIASLNTITTIPLRGFEARAILKDEGFIYIVMEKLDGGTIVQKYNLLDSMIVGSAIASNFQF